MSWNADPQVEAVFGRSFEELIERRPRRQNLDGFEPVYSDIVDYIVRCTYRIWEEKDVGLIRTHYGTRGPVFTLAGGSDGAEEVVRNTLRSLAGHPDRKPVAEEVIWSEDAPGVFLSSHRLISYATFVGPDGMFDKISGKRDAILVMADCVCRQNQIVEEWLVRDYVQFARRLGFDPRALAQQLAAADQVGDPTRHEWRAKEIERVRAAPIKIPPADHPAAPLAQALRQAFIEDMYGEAAKIVAPAVEMLWPSGRHLVGRGAWIGCLIQLRSNLSEQCFAIDHWAARPMPDGDVAVALRWWLVGKHTGQGVWGPASGKDLLILGISHYRLRAGRVIEDITLFDELAVLRQVNGGLGA